MASSPFSRKQLKIMKWMRKIKKWRNSKKRISQMTKNWMYSPNNLDLTTLTPSFSAGKSKILLFWWRYQNPAESFSGRQSKVLFRHIIESPITFYDTGLDIISADVNTDFTVLVTSHVQGIVQFHSIADVDNIYLFKEFKLLEKGTLDHVLFSSNCNEVAAVSVENKRLFYILTDLKQDF